jgi:hypothetical protein
MAVLGQKRALAARPATPSVGLSLPTPKGGGFPAHTRFGEFGQGAAARAHSCLQQTEIIIRGVAYPLRWPCYTGCYPQ